MYIYIYIYICLYICIYIYKYINTHKYIDIYMGGNQLPAVGGSVVPGAPGCLVAEGARR